MNRSIKEMMLHRVPNAGHIEVNIAATVARRFSD